MQVIRRSRLLGRSKVLAGTPYPDIAFTLSNGVTVDIPSLDTGEVYQVSIGRSDMERFIQAMDQELKRTGGGATR